MRTCRFAPAVLFALLTASLSTAEEVAKVNFQPAGAQVPADHVADSGQPYTATRGYGWDDDVSTVERNFVPDQILDTYAFVKNGSQNVWEYALANGDYEVTLSCGSPQWSGRHTVSIEGTTVLTAVDTTQSNVVVTKHAVTVLDGRLSIELGGTTSGRKTKLQYVLIESVDGGGGPPPPPSPPNTPPTVTTTASVTTGTAPLEVAFTTTAEDDEGPIALIEWTFGDGEGATILEPTHTYATAGVYTAKIVVTDAGGLTAEATVAITVDEPSGPPPPPPPPPPSGEETRINFQPPGAAPTPYLPDSGLPFTTPRGYGWDRTIPNKARGVNPDVVRDTYCYALNGTPATWEHLLANGNYEVTVVCGSPQWSGIHTVEVEGTNVMNSVPTGPAEYVEVLREPVTVNDGRLSIRIGGTTGGKKTKLCYVIIHGSTGGEPVGEPPTATPSATPLTGDAPLTVTFTGAGTDDGTIDAYSWVFGDGATSIVQSPIHIYDTPGTYAAKLTVIDNDGNTADATVTIVVTGEAPPPPPPPPPPGIVTASAETDPVPTSGDAADDPAIWIHPTDVSLSVIIGTDKAGGHLIGYDLSGAELWQLADSGAPNNVDVRGDTVVCSLRHADALGVFLMDPDTRTLTKQGEIKVDVDAYGLCLYVSPTTGKLHAFVSGNRGGAEQWEIALAPLTGTLVRELDVAKTEGMAADDETGKLFLAEENTGLYVYDAEPGGGQTRTKIEGIGSKLAGDVEGVTIYYAADGKGYVIASDQGPDRYVLFNRAAPHAYVGTFQIKSHPDSPAPGAHDGTTETDGIHVLNLALGDDFPSGIFIAHDGLNTRPTEAQNFKLVPWERIADLLNLEKDTTFVPGE